MRSSKSRRERMPAARLGSKARGKSAALRRKRLEQRAEKLPLVEAVLRPCRASAEGPRSIAGETPTTRVQLRAARLCRVRRRA